MLDKPSGICLLLELFNEGPAFPRGSRLHLVSRIENGYSPPFWVSLCSHGVVRSDSLIFSNYLPFFYFLPVGMLFVNKLLFFHFHLSVFIAYWQKGIIGTLKEITQSTGFSLKLS